MPAAAVIPAPIGYIKVVAVEKLVVVLVASRRRLPCLRESAGRRLPLAILWAQAGQDQRWPWPVSTPSLRANWSAQSRLYSFEHLSLE